MSTKIIFNGKTYTDSSDMPTDVRQAYQQALEILADKNKNGIPDLLEAAGLGNVISVQHSQIIVNGQSYGGPEEMPPAVRRLYEQALGQGSAVGTDLPDPVAGSFRTDVSSGQPVAGPGLQLKWGSDEPTGSSRLGRFLALLGAAILGFLLVALLAEFGR